MDAVILEASSVLEVGPDGTEKRVSGHIGKGDYSCRIRPESAAEWQDFDTFDAVLEFVGNECLGRWVFVRGDGCVGVLRGGRAKGCRRGRRPDPKRYVLGPVTVHKAWVNPFPRRQWK